MFAETHIEPGLDSCLSQAHHVVGHLVQSPKLLDCHCQIQVCVCVCLSLSQMVREFSSAQVLILLYVDKKGDQERVVPYVFCN